MFILFYIYMSFIHKTESQSKPFKRIKFYLQWNKNRNKVISEINKKYIKN
jgi:hypothetical protein